MLSSLVAVWNLKDSNFWELQDLHLRNQEIWGASPVPSLWRHTLAGRKRFWKRNKLWPSGSSLQLGEGSREQKQLDSSSAYSKWNSRSHFNLIQPHLGCWEDLMESNILKTKTLSKALWTMKLLQHRKPFTLLAHFFIFCILVWLYCILRFSWAGFSL